MRYADDSCRSALLQRLLPLREREPSSAPLYMRFASETQPDPNPLLSNVRCRAANLDTRPSGRGRLLTDWPLLQGDSMETLGTGGYRELPRSPRRISERR
jgi:hypothetical protein